MTGPTPRQHPTDPDAPSASRAVALLAAALAAGAVLLGLPTTAPPTNIDDVLTWWADVGTPNATMAIVQSIGLVIAASTVLLGALGVVVALTPRRPGLLIWRRLAPHSVRRFIAASALVSSSLTASVAGASDPSDIPVLIELEADTLPVRAISFPVLRDIGPATDPADTALSGIDRAEPEPLDTWTVAPGDHLWRIAAETVALRDPTSGDNSVELYWRRLIDTNRQVIGDDADLIHPGQLLTLPE